MQRKLSRRKATTLIELIVVLVMMGFFIMMVFNMFNVTYDAYQFNRELAAKTYAQANVDNFFEIFERELMYAGSLGAVIKKINDSDFLNQDAITVETSTEQSTITVRYALAEQLILTKKDKEYYKHISPPLSSSTDLTFFPLYRATIPTSLSDRWALAYDEVSPVSNTTLFLVDSISQSDVNVQVSAAVTKNLKMFVITPDNPAISNPATYVSLLLHEKSFDSLNTKNRIILDNDATWTGEMIYKTIIYLDSATDSSEKKLMVKKVIPTVSDEYEIALMDNILAFEATDTGELYIATVSYLIPGIYKGFLKKGLEEASVTVTRRFFKP